MDGKVLKLSQDAVADEDRGLLNQAWVLMDQAWIGGRGKRVSLAPGLGVAVEGNTGRRRAIDYFLTAVLQHRSESSKARQLTRKKASAREKTAAKLMGQL